MNDQRKTKHAAESEHAAEMTELSPCEPLSLSSVPLNDMIQLLAGVGVDLLRQVTCHERLSLGAAVESVPDGADILQRLAEFCLGDSLPDSPWSRGRRFLIDRAGHLGPLQQFVTRREASATAAGSRRLRLQKSFARRAAGRGSTADLSGFLNGFLTGQLAAGSGCAIPVSMWHTASLAAWTNLDFCRQATDLIHGVLRSRICRSRQWDRAPNLHPNTFWLLIRLAAPRDAAPKRMLHLLRGLAERALQEPGWARFWDQWVLAEALECPMWRVPHSVLLLPYVLEQDAASEPASSPDSAPTGSTESDSTPARTDLPLSPLSDPKWNEDRPECLFVPWPPAVSDSEERTHAGFTRSLQRNLRHVSRKRAARTHAKKP